LPCSVGECLKIIRIEDGSPNELVNVLLTVVGGEGIPSGSAVVIFSASHLVLRGLEGYIRDLSAEMMRIEHKFKGGVISFPGVPILMDGLTDPTATRNILEFGKWLKTTGEPAPVNTWDLLISTFYA